MRYAHAAPRLLVGGAILGAAMFACVAGGTADASFDSAGTSKGSHALAGAPGDSAAEVSASSEFAFGLFREIASRSRASNIFISPISASLALGMLQSGADGQTRSEIARMLNAAGSERIDAANAALIEQLTGGRDVELLIANSLWTAERIAFHPDFLSRTLSFYRAEAAALDLSSAAAMDRINGWVNENTHGRIEGILDEPPGSDAVLVLLNAVYFKGDWLSPFDSSRTRNQPFHTAKGTRDVPMMVQQSGLRYHRGENFQLVRLPYRGDRVAMWVMLPDSGNSTADLRAQLSTERWQSWRAAARRMDVIVSLPRFKADHQVNLIPPLESLGMVQAFDPARADLTRMLSRRTQGGANIYVSGARQRAVVEVNESGTVAAAVTALEVKVASAPPPPPHMLVDRPFLVVIQDERSGAVLFMGEIGEP